MITISLCMIVKNEEAVLERILKSMSKAADQIVIIDTGSSDRTKEIARKYTDDIFDFPWKDDFAAARNAACEHASMDYWMWLDADDVIDPQNLDKLIKLKETLSPLTDVVMMKYLTGFDKDGKCSFSYYRERLIKNHKGFSWQGRVHEAITPSGVILYSDIEVRHQKEGAGDPDRNLRIYEAMLEDQEILEPRHQFYYARELYYHRRFEDAAAAFQQFLDDPGGWVENKIDACLHLSICLESLKRPGEAMEALFKSFLYDKPRGEACCELGRMKLDQERITEAIYWYGQAFSMEPNEQSGAFVQRDCYDFLPAMGLCISFDKLGDHKKAYDYHKKARKLKPDHEAVKLNQAYFERILKH